MDCEPYLWISKPDFPISVSEFTLLTGLWTSCKETAEKLYERVQPVSTRGLSLVKNCYIAKGYPEFISPVVKLFLPKDFLSEFIIGSEATTVLPDRANRLYRQDIDFCLWQRTSPLCIVAELAGGGSAIDGAPMSSFCMFNVVNCKWWILPSGGVPSGIICF